MDPTRFDAITRRLTEMDWSRRRVAAALGIGILTNLTGGRVLETTAKSKNKKKKKKKGGSKNQPPSSPPASPPTPPPGSPCVTDCAGKVCGNDGCGGSCGGCGNGASCSGGQCVASSCSAPCTSNQICQNGACVCPPGLKECAGPGYLATCHECCVDAFTGPPDQECNASPNGEYCLDDDGDFVLRCGCLSGTVLCNDGRCGECCNDAFCLATQGQGRFCNANHVCACPGTATWCSVELGCRDTTSDKDACGPTCMDCGPGWECKNSRCCLELGGNCALNSNECCAGLQCVNTGTVFDPVMVCA